MKTVKKEALLTIRLDVPPKVNQAMLADYVRTAVQSWDPEHPMFAIEADSVKVRVVEVKTHTKYT